MGKRMIVFSLCKYLVVEIIMPDQPKPSSPETQIIEFVRCLKGILTSITSPPSPEISELGELLAGRPFGERPSPADFHRVGEILLQRKNPTMGEISQALSVPFSTATRLMNWWVENGFAQRLSDPNDRRIVRVGLTERGERLLAAIERHIAQTAEKVLAPLGAEEREALLRLLSKVAAGLKQKSP